MVKTLEIRKALCYEPWESMLSRLSCRKSESKKEKGPDQKSKQPIKHAGQVSLSELSPEAKILGLDCIQRIEFQYSERSDWTNLFGGTIQRAKKDLLNKKLVREVFLGKSLFLAPTEELYNLFGMECPYKRNTWELHSFLVLLAAKLVEYDPLNTTGEN